MIQRTKVLDGVYQVGSTSINRDGTRWFIVGRRFQGIRYYGSLKVATIAARVYEGDEITTAEYTLLAQEND